MKPDKLWFPLATFAKSRGRECLGDRKAIRSVPKVDVARENGVIEPEFDVVSGSLHTPPSHESEKCADERTKPLGRVLPFPATAIRRKRGPSLSRRVGQTGNVFQHGHTKQWNPAAPVYGRYW